jgi:ribose transport system substrate-binding protein
MDASLQRGTPRRRPGLLLGFVIAGAVAVLVPTAATAGAHTRSSEPIVAYATAAVKKLTTPSTTWTGPTTGPKLAPDKTIVYVDGDASNSVNALWGTYLEQVGKRIGWTVKLIDGKGTAAGWQTAMEQALALKPDGIVTSTDGATMSSEFAKAQKLGIPVVGFHLTAGPGAYPQYHVYWNIGGKPQSIGAALADYIIADSQGKGSAIILYDHQYAVATMKAVAMKQEFAKCKTCKLLLYDSLPLNQMQTLVPQAMTSWVQKYPKPFYVMTCCDVYYDFAVVPLQTAHVPTSDVRLLGMDAPPTAYARIRSGKYEVVSVPEPQEEQAYQAIDELNRAIQHQKPSTYVPPTYLVTKANVNQAGGPQSQYKPAYPFAANYLKIWGVK